ncbi:undecaprenyl-diphosphate phosphatase [Vineibacter terrae]|uniref:undecaprenyl-diphosphate phosphatase n=1 Tax=Vineibacter terrae TaxID=2586908 RepID=UPI002E2F72D8|nr:undecaprenyl-diphosphate phosphatase [Vineibacter terrae]HEX2888819.1 undecaprenyl-diphosphate phosphatase [Vineibacter terrae]
MDVIVALKALLLGVLEGLTEFIPVSSTGHLILMEAVLGFEGPKGRVFEIVIQLGAILAICWLYRAKIWATLAGLFRDPVATRFAVNVAVAFLPAAVIGALAHGLIKSVLFNPWVVATSLVVGGFIILLIERIAPRPAIKTVDGLSWKTALGIGFCQTVAMIPGVSRSGATIMGARMFGVDRPTSAEFSFFLAMPTMLGATVYDVFKNWSTLGADTDGILLIVIGFTAAFIAAMAVVSRLIAFISRYGFAPFAWYRIVLGIVALALLGLGAMG